MHLLTVGSPPRFMLHPEDPHHSDDWIAERMDAQRAWAEMKDTPAGRILWAIFAGYRLSADAVEAHAPGGMLSTEIWVRIAAGVLLTHINNEQEQQ